MRTILLVDDEKRMLDLLELYLSPRGYRCIKCESGLSALDTVESNNIDLVLLDIMMPDMDGFEICRRLREISEIPIIMLTARDQIMDKVKGLNLGADDYITKPFDEAELLARVNAVLRRLSNKDDKIEFNGLLWDEVAFKVLYRNHSIHLTPKEFAVLGLFLKNPSRVFSREQMILSLWGYHSDTDERTIDSHVKNLREKLRKAGFPVDQFLHTVWGIGYKWVE